MVFPSNITTSFKVLVRCFTYNQSQYIEDALNGFAMQQTNFPFVCLVMDDCSTDGEQEVIKAYLDRECDMSKAEFFEDDTTTTTLVPHRTNVNCTFAAYLLKKNLHKVKGAKMAYVTPWREHCEYEALCEGDDYWIDPLKLQKQVNFLEKNPECGFCYTDVYTCNAEGVINKSCLLKERIPPKTFEEQLISSSYMAPLTWMYRQELVTCFESNKLFTDGTFAMSLEFFQHTCPFFMDDVTGVYRVHDSGATSQKDPVKYFKYLRGIFDAQLYYCSKYSCSQELADRIKVQTYTDFMLPALEAHDQSFIDEAIDFYRGKGMDMRWFIDRCSTYVGYHKQLESIRRSKAYRLGKKILLPMSKVKQMINRKK